MEREKREIWKDIEKNKRHKEIDDKDSKTETGHYTEHQEIRQNEIG